MAKLDWLFLPVEIDDDEGEDGARRLAVGALNRLHPQPNIAERRSKVSLRFEQAPGKRKMKPLLTRRR